VIDNFSNFIVSKEKPISENITYNDMDSSVDNLWNFLKYGIVFYKKECLLEIVS